MSSTYSTNLAIELIGTGDQAGAWGNTTNTNLGTLIEQAISGYVTQAVSTGGTTAITIPNGSTGVARNMFIELTGTGGASTFLEVPSNKKLYFIYNNTNGAVTVRVSGQTGVSVAAGEKKILVSNGTDVVEATTYIVSGGSANLTTLTVTSANITTLTGTTFGDTGTTNLRGVSGNITTLTGSVFGAVATTQLRGASGVITTLTGTTSTYTDVRGTSGNITTLTGTTATYASGTIGQFGATSANITTLTGTTATYTSGTIGQFGATSANITTLTGTNFSLTSLTLSNGLAVASGGTGATSAANARTNLGLAIGTDIPSPTGTGASGTWGISISGNAATATNGVVTTGSYANPSWITSLAASKLTGTVAVANGGTALSSTPTNGQLLIGNGSGYTLAALTAGTGISITNGAGSVSIAATSALTGTTSANLTALGVGAAASLTSGSSNTCVGYNAGNSINTGGYNTLVGHAAGDSITDSNWCSMVGYFAGNNVTTGTANTFMGYYAGNGVSTGGLNVAIGDSSFYTGNHTNSVALGYDAQITGSNQGQIGNGNVDVYAKSFNNTSDLRDKADVQSTNLGLDFVMQLQPRMFRWDMREFYRPQKPGPNATQAERDAYNEASKLANLTHDGTHKRNRFHQGLVAQEVKTVMDSMGVDFGGFRDASVNGGDAQMGLEYTQFIAPLIKAIQELKAEFDEYKRTHP